MLPGDVFQLLRNHLMVDESGNAVQNYVVNGRRVCRFIFLLNFAISEATLKCVLERCGAGRQECRPRQQLADAELSALCVHQKAEQRFDQSSTSG